MRPVDADAIYNKALEDLKKGEIEDWEADSIIDYLDDAPTINDAEIVVRCRYCAAWKRNVGIADSPNGHCFEHDIDTNGQDFCSYGEYQTNTGGVTE